MIHFQLKIYSRITSSLYVKIYQQSSPVITSHHQSFTKSFTHVLRIVLRKVLRQSIKMYCPSLSPVYHQSITKSITKSITHYLTKSHEKSHTCLAQVSPNILRKIFESFTHYFYVKLNRFLF